MKSSQLRKVITENGGGKSMSNKKAKKIENDVVQSVLLIKKYLEKKYSNYQFEHKKIITKTEITKSLGLKNYVPASKKSFIKPDGGVLYVNFGDGVLWPILIAEAKQQGTNDIRQEEGKKKQPKGNAVERAYKNFNELKLFCKNITFFPYVIFVSGCDFSPGSSIIDRLDSLTEYKPRNKILVKDEAKIASVFMRDSGFNQEEIYETMKKIVNISIDELIKKNDK
jgi:type II restriction enzyme